MEKKNNENYLYENSLISSFCFKEECIKSVNNFFNGTNKEREKSNENKFNLNKEFYDEKKDKIFMVKDQNFFTPNNQKTLEKLIVSNYSNNLCINKDKDLKEKNYQGNNNKDLIIENFDNGKSFAIL